MKKSLTFSTVLCLFVAVPILLGAANFVAEDSDLVSIRGQGEFNVVNGTVIKKHYHDGEWFGLFSRNSGSYDIELSVEPGKYYVETWSIASNPMNPQRVHTGMTVEIGDGGGTGPGMGIPQLTDLLAAWGPCTGECPYDFTGDGNVGAADLLYLLSMWGQ